MAAAALSVKNLCFTYEGEDVLQAIDFKLEKNAFLAIIGPNGGGKTTLLKLLAGLLKPDKGTVEVLGLPPAKACAKIGYVPQNTNINMDFPITVFDVVMMGAEKNDRKSAEDALRSVGILELAEKKIGTLSGGQRQRVMIARALASKKTEILFLDEPTSHIDTDAQREIYALLKTLCEKMTVVIVSHDLTLVAHYATKVAYVNRSLVFHEAPSSENREEVLSAGDGHVCEVELLNAMWKNHA